MEPFSFIFFAGLLGIIAATVQDLKTTEIPNWIGFALIASGISYRAFYSIENGSWNILLLGVAGVGVFTILSNIFYYGKMFAGGDAKLLIALGALIPGEGWTEVAYYASFFIIVLFGAGALYTLSYSSMLAFREWGEFSNEIRKQTASNRIAYILGIILCIIFASVGLIIKSNAIFFASLLSLIIPFLYFYLKSVESACLIKWKSPENLIEGDWIVKSLRIGKREISPNVHGLSEEEIKLLIKRGKKVLVKEGIVFTPAFLIAWVVTGYATSSGLGFFQFFLGL